MPGVVNRKNRDYYGGLLIFIFGVSAVAQGRTYEVGSLTEMGPGFFPVALGVILVLNGIVLVAVARVSSGTDDVQRLAPEWAAWGRILAAIAAFVIIGKFGGLVPATFVLVFVSALADRQNTLKGAFLLALSMVVIAVAVFWWALQLPFPLFSWG
jgi:hypothetical protein